MNKPNMEAFTEVEWERLIHSPIAVGMVVMTADLNIPGLLNEGQAMYKAIDNQFVPESVEELITAVVSDIHDLPEDAYQIPAQIDPAHPDKQENNLLKKICEIRVLLDAKLDPQQADDFKRWLLSIAAAVSKASIEGGFLGIGGEKVSDREAQSLNEIASALGVDQ